jgi:hypothetical protein
MIVYQQVWKKSEIKKTHGSRWNRGTVAPSYLTQEGISGCDPEFPDCTGIECPDRLFQTVAHFFFFCSCNASFVESQHFMPVLNLSL